LKHGLRAREAGGEGKTSEMKPKKEKKDATLEELFLKFNRDGGSTKGGAKKDLRTGCKKNLQTTKGGGDERGELGSNRHGMMFGNAPGWEKLGGSLREAARPAGQPRGKLLKRIHSKEENVFLWSPQVACPKREGGDKEHYEWPGEGVSYT